MDFDPSNPFNARGPPSDYGGNSSQQRTPRGVSPVHQHQAHRSASAASNVSQASYATSYQSNTHSETQSTKNRLLEAHAKKMNYAEKKETEDLRRDLNGLKNHVHRLEQNIQYVNPENIKFIMDRLRKLEFKVGAMVLPKGYTHHTFNSSMGEGNAAMNVGTIAAFSPDRSIDVSYGQSAREMMASMPSPSQGPSAIRGSAIGSGHATSTDWVLHEKLVELRDMEWIERVDMYMEELMMRSALQTSFINETLFLAQEILPLAQLRHTMYPGGSDHGEDHQGAATTSRRAREALARVKASGLVPSTVDTGDDSNGLFEKLKQQVAQQKSQREGSEGRLGGPAIYEDMLSPLSDTGGNNATKERRSASASRTRGGSSGRATHDAAGEGLSPPPAKPAADQHESLDSEAAAAVVAPLVAKQLLESSMITELIKTQADTHLREADLSKMVDDSNRNVLQELQGDICNIVKDAVAAEVDEFRDAVTKPFKSMAEKRQLAIEHAVADGVEKLNRDGDALTDKLFKTHDELQQNAKEAHEARERDATEAAMMAAMSNIKSPSDDGSLIDDNGDLSGEEDVQHAVAGVYGELTERDLQRLAELLSSSSSAAVHRHTAHSQHFSTTSSILGTETEAHQQSVKHRAALRRLLKTRELFVQPQCSAASTAAGNEAIELLATAKTPSKVLTMPATGEQGADGTTPNTSSVPAAQNNTSPLLTVLFNPTALTTFFTPSSSGTGGWEKLREELIRSIKLLALLQPKEVESWWGQPGARLLHELRQYLPQALVFILSESHTVLGDHLDMLAARTSEHLGKLDDDLRNVLEDVDHKVKDLSEAAKNRAEDAAQDIEALTNKINGVEDRLENIKSRCQNGQKNTGTQLAAVESKVAQVCDNVDELEGRLEVLAAQQQQQQQRAVSTSKDDDPSSPTSPAHTASMLKDLSHQLDKLRQAQQTLRADVQLQHESMGSMSARVDDHEDRIQGLETRPVAFSPSPTRPQQVVTPQSAVVVSTPPVDAVTQQLLQQRMLQTIQPLEERMDAMQAKLRQLEGLEDAMEHIKRQVENKASSAEMDALSTRCRKFGSDVAQLDGRLTVHIEKVAEEMQLLADQINEIAMLVSNLGGGSVGGGGGGFSHNNSPYRFHRRPSTSLRRQQSLPSTPDEINNTLPPMAMMMMPGGGSMDNTPNRGANDTRQMEELRRGQQAHEAATQNAIDGLTQQVADLTRALQRQHEQQQQEQEQQRQAEEQRRQQQQALSAPQRPTVVVPHVADGNEEDERRSRSTGSDRLAQLAIPSPKLSHGRPSFPPPTTTEATTYTIGTNTLPVTSVAGVQTSRPASSIASTASEREHDDDLSERLSETARPSAHPLRPTTTSNNNQSEDSMTAEMNQALAIDQAIRDRALQLKRQRMGQPSLGDTETTGGGSRIQIQPAKTTSRRSPEPQRGRHEERHPLTVNEQSTVPAPRGPYAYEPKSTETSGNDDDDDDDENGHWNTNTDFTSIASGGGGFSPRSVSVSSNTAMQQQQQSSSDPFAHHNRIPLRRSPSRSPSAEQLSTSAVPALSPSQRGGGLLDDPNGMDWQTSLRNQPGTVFHTNNSANVKPMLTPHAAGTFKEISRALDFYDSTSPRGGSGGQHVSGSTTPQHAVVQMYQQMQQQQRSTPRSASAPTSSEPREHSTGHTLSGEKQRAPRGAAVRQTSGASFGDPPATPLYLRQDDLPPAASDRSATIAASAAARHQREALRLQSPHARKESPSKKPLNLSSTAEAITKRLTGKQYCTNKYCSIGHPHAPHEHHDEELVGRGGGGSGRQGNVGGAQEYRGGGSAAGLMATRYSENDDTAPAAISKRIPSAREQPSRIRPAPKQQRSSSSATAKKAATATRSGNNTPSDTSTDVPLPSAPSRKPGSKQAAMKQLRPHQQGRE